MTDLAPRLLDLLQRGLLVDPQTLRPLSLSEDGAWLINAVDGVRYPIHNGVPRLLSDAAEPLPPAP